MAQDLLNLGSAPDWRKSQIPLPAYNCSSEDAPPFACMQLKKPKNLNRSDTGVADTELNDEADAFFVNEKIGGQVILNVCKPDKEGTTYQSPARFVFAGEKGIKAHAFGTVYQGYPARTLHDGRLNRLVNWEPCGPIENEWFVKSGKSAFICMSHDISSPVGQGDVHTVLIAPNYAPSTVAAATSELDPDVAIGAYIEFPNAVPGDDPTLDLDSLDTPFGILFDEDENGNTKARTIRVPVTGKYKFTFNATIWSDTAVRGDPLTITAFKYSAERDDEPASTTTTEWAGSCSQEIEKDTSGGSDVIAEVRGRQNISFTGIIKDMQKYDGLRFKNTSGVAIKLGYPAITIELLARTPISEEAEGSALKYPAP